MVHLVTSELRAHRRIGNGHATCMGIDSWLPQSMTSLATTPLLSTLHFAPVSSLFFISGYTWDIDLVRDIFNTEDSS